MLDCECSMSGSLRMVRNVARRFGVDAESVKAKVTFGNDWELWSVEICSDFGRLEVIGDGGSFSAACEDAIVKIIDSRKRE